MGDLLFVVFLGLSFTMVWLFWLIFIFSKFFFFFFFFFIAILIGIAAIQDMMPIR